MEYRSLARITPDLRVLDYSGPGRHELLLKASEYDVLVTSYGLLRRDIETLRQQRFRCVILDEAQAGHRAGSRRRLAPVGALLRRRGRGRLRGHRAGVLGRRAG